MINKKNGFVSFVHDQGIYDEPNYGPFRKSCYTHLTYWFRFINEKILFSQVGHAKKFEISIFGNEKTKISFDAISNLFHPSTIDKCYADSGNLEVPGIKDENDNWQLSGHKDRVLTVDEKLLSLFANLYDPPDTDLYHARMPIVHATQIIKVFQKISIHPLQFIKYRQQYYISQMFNETISQQNGTIERKTVFPETIQTWIVSGPHFNISNPFYQTPKRICNTHQAYDVLDLTEISNSFIPRTNYIPACSTQDYMIRTPKVPWGRGEPTTHFYRLFYRGRLNISQERSFLSAIMPPGTAHIHSVQSVTFEDLEHLLYAAFFTSTILFDFLVKSAGRSGFSAADFAQIPIIENQKVLSNGILRTLRLNCITSQYAELWKELWNDKWLQIRWAQNDERLNNDSYLKLNYNWNRNTPFRTDFERRQALIENDILASIGLGLTLDQLKTIFRAQFPIMKQYEKDTWFDNMGRIVFTNSKGLVGVGFTRQKWNEIKDMKSGTVERTITDDTLPGGPRERTIVYQAPFDRCDREKDYEIAWAEFERRFASTKYTNNTK